MAIRFVSNVYRNICVVIFLVTICPFPGELFTANALELDKNGGYGIVVGIGPTDTNSELAEYMRNVKTMIQDFSQLLWESTDSAFHIKSVQILVPDSWVTPLEANVSLKATYHGADIQISKDFKVPLVENLHPCGKPGVRIQLPTEFVNQTHADEVYGSRAKGLLNLWLRYRFGVWEEHGYPAHTITPYLYNLNNVPESCWRLTSCNNSELNGDFAPQINANPNDTCTLNGTAPIGDDCRFYPYQDHGRNNATSSLMNFHWVESLTQLCNETSHDQLAPNRQNLHCNFISVWEVVKASTDYECLHKSKASQSKPKQSPPQIEFDIVGTSPFPLLYILLDVQFPHYLDNYGLYSILQNGWAEFVHELPTHVIVKLFRFPNLLGPVAAPEIQVAVDWSLIDAAGVVKEKLIDALEISDEGVHDLWDLRLGISQVMADLRERDHPHGAVLLILRTDNVPFVYANKLGHGAYEEDYILELKQYNVKMCAIEIAYSNNPVNQNQLLPRVAEESNGVSGLIFLSEPGSALGTMRPILQHVQALLGAKGRQKSLDKQRKYELVYQQLAPLLGTQTTSVFIPKRTEFEFLHVYVTVTGGRLESIDFDPGAEGSELPSPPNRLEFQERPEYFDYVSADPPDEIYRGHIYFSVFRNEELDESDESSRAWILNMVAADATDTADSKIEAMITVYVSISEDSAAASADNNANANALSCEISISTIHDDQFSCTCQQTSEEPLAIYAKLTDSNGKPIFGPSPVAKLVEMSTGVTMSVELNDAGFGADLLDEDGVYSGYIYPRVAGMYEIYVTLYETKANTSMEVTRVGIPGRVLPNAKQTDLTDVVTSGVTLTTPYSVVFKWHSILHVATPCSDKKHISRITDLRVDVNLVDEFTFNITFTVPVMTATESEQGEVFNYEGTTSLASNLSILIDSFGAGTLRHFSIVGASPGDTFIQSLIEEPGLNFIAIQLLHVNGSFSSNSPITLSVAGVLFFLTKRAGSPLHLSIAA